MAHHRGRKPINNHLCKQSLSVLEGRTNLLKYSQNSENQIPLCSGQVPAGPHYSNPGPKQPPHPPPPRLSKLRGPPRCAKMWWSHLVPRPWGLRCSGCPAEMPPSHFGSEQSTLPFSRQILAQTVLKTPQSRDKPRLRKGLPLNLLPVHLSPGCHAARPALVNKGVPETKPSSSGAWQPHCPA